MKFSGRDFKIKTTIINIYRDLKEKINIMREMEDIKKMEPLELKYIIFEIKNLLLDGPMYKLEE